jgi:hypothetical protein
MVELMDFKKIIESAGAEFVRVENGSVFFTDPQSGARLSLYLFALDAENVRLSLKGAREPQPIGFESLARAEGL